jgi:hypothetical protein
LAGIFILSLIEKDYSFNTKLGVLEGMKKMSEYNINNILFGFGFSKGIYAYSYRDDAYGHLHIALIIGQYGILGLVLFIIFFFYMACKTKGGTLLITIGFIIAGFSLMYFSPCFFWVFGIISVLSKKNYTNNSDWIIKG